MLIIAGNGTSKISEEVKDEVIKLLESGLSTRKIANQVGVSDASISNIAKERGYSFEKKAGELARKCHKTYAQVDRIETIAEFINKCKEMLPDIEKAKDMRDMSVSLGILIDKRRLEDTELDKGKGGELLALLNEMEKKGDDSTDS